MGFANEGLVTDAMDKAKVELGCNTEDEVIIVVNQRHLCSNTVYRCPCLLLRLEKRTLGQSG